jgi:hypothetical protein
MYLRMYTLFSNSQARSHIHISFFRFRYGTFCHAIVGMMRNPPPAFKDVVQKHFALKKEDIIAQCQQWREEEEGVATQSQQSRSQGESDIFKSQPSHKEEKGGIVQSLGSWVGSIFGGGSGTSASVAAAGGGGGGGEGGGGGGGKKKEKAWSQPFRLLRTKWGRMQEELEDIYNSPQAAEWLK